MTNYKWNAEDYVTNSKSQQLWAKELIDKLNLKGNETVLDLGCGDGRITCEISTRLSSGKVIGIDSSSDMIKLASQRYPANQYNNLKFLIGDASNLQFNNEFNVVFSNATLHWIKEHIPVLKGIYNSLLPGGFALFQMGGKGNAEDILTVLSDLMRDNNWAKYFLDFNFSYGFYGPDVYKKWVEQTGFNVKRIELIPKDMVHKNSGELAGWIRTTWLPYTQRIPDILRDKFINELVDNYLLKIPYDDKGNIHIKMYRLEVEIQKPESI